MKKILFILSVALFFAIQSINTFAEVSAKEMAMARRAGLNGTQWTISVKPSDGKGQAETDVLSFAAGKVSSNNLANAGFAQTDFTVRIDEENDGTIWETMQIDENGNYAFWRGDINNGAMRGILTRRDSRGRNTDYVFESH